MQLGYNLERMGDNSGEQGHGTAVQMPPEAVGLDISISNISLETNL